MKNRIRSFAVAAALALLPAAASAQAASTNFFAKGSKIASVGVMTGGDYEGFGFGGSFEVGIIDFTSTLSLGVGGMIGYIQNEEFGFDFSYMPVMAIGNVHLALPTQPKLDLYGGLSLGIVRVSADCGDFAGSTIDCSSSDSGLGLQVGARYAMTPRVSLMGQLGINDIPLLYAGASFKF